jgi:restriction system protein
MQIESIIDNRPKQSFLSVLVSSLKDIMADGKHKPKIKQSKRLLSKLNYKSFRQKPASFFGYIRKIDPFVFEELLLTCFAKRGFMIKRNKAYTGDGGIDGKVKLNGQWWLIQAKRYQSHINPKHVDEFKQVVARGNYGGGLFIHTGKTGGKSYQSMSVQGGQNIVLISGHNLHKFVTEAIN